MPVSPILIVCCSKSASKAVGNVVHEELGWGTSVCSLALSELLVSHPIVSLPRLSLAVGDQSSFACSAETLQVPWSCWFICHFGNSVGGRHSLTLAL